MYRRRNRFSYRQKVKLLDRRNAQRRNHGTNNATSLNSTPYPCYIRQRHAVCRACLCDQFNHPCPHRPPSTNLRFQSHRDHGILRIIFRRRLQGANGLSLVPYTTVLRLTIPICHHGELRLFMKFARLQTIA